MSKASKVFNEVYASSEEYVHSYNPENADYTNPRGAWHRVRYFVVINNEYGDRLRHIARFEREASAERFAATVQAAINDGVSINDAYWRAERPVYGSDAYIDYGQADDLATEARELEEESWGWN